MTTEYQKRYEALSRVVSIEIYSVALDHFGSEKSLMSWFFKKNSSLDNCMPYTRCAEGKMDLVGLALDLLVKQSAKKS